MCLITLHAYIMITCVSVPCRMMKVQKQITHPLVSSEQAWVTRNDHGMGRWSSICTYAPVGTCCVQMYIGLCLLFDILWWLDMLLLYVPHTHVELLGLCYNIVVGLVLFVAYMEQWMHEPVGWIVIRAWSLSIGYCTNLSLFTVLITKRCCTIIKGEARGDLYIFLRLWSFWMRIDEGWGYNRLLL